uniref:BZIP domain-containing protein n=1 Tax=Panagrolaimus sp. ES5 TaxID=591445 RepID=A0AC34G2W2_9BILA
MTEDIPQCHAQCPDQVLLGEDQHPHNMDNSIFFATNESYVYEYFEESTSENIESQSSPSHPVILYKLIDCFVDEVRGEIKAEKDIQPQNSSSPPEFKCENSFFETENHGKKFSLFGMTYEELNDRKREQNKSAARRYRAKKQKEFETNKSEISRLEKRNGELRDMEKFLGEQIAYYKETMISKVNS